MDRAENCLRVIQDQIFGTCEKIFISVHLRGYINFYEIVKMISVVTRLLRLQQG